MWRSVTIYQAVVCLNLHVKKLFLLVLPESTVDHLGRLGSTERMPNKILSLKFLKDIELAGTWFCIVFRIAGTEKHNLPAKLRSLSTTRGPQGYGFPTSLRSRVIFIHEAMQVCV